MKSDVDSKGAPALLALRSFFPWLLLSDVGYGGLEAQIFTLRTRRDASYTGPKHTSIRAHNARVKGAFPLLGPERMHKAVVGVAVFGDDQLTEPMPDQVVSCPAGH